MENVRSHLYKSRCPICKKFLCQPMVTMKITSENQDGFEYIKKNTEIVLSAQTKCRRCKKIMETKEIAFKK